MQTIPTEVKKQKITVYLTPSQRVSLALTSKKELQWLRPVIKFMNMSIKDKIIFLKKSPQASHIMDEIVMESLSKEHDPIMFISLLKDLSDERHKSLKPKIRKLVEDRIRDRNYRKGLKPTMIELYLEYLLSEKKSVPRFINTIENAHIKSITIEKYIQLTKKDFTPTTLRKWIEKMPDEYTRTKTMRKYNLV